MQNNFANCLHVIISSKITQIRSELNGFLPPLPIAKNRSTLFLHSNSELELFIITIKIIH